MRQLSVIFKRELASYFATPLAYVFLMIFLVMSGVFTFYLGGFYERNQADLTVFFGFHPWLYLFLVPAIAMRLWAEERKSGTIELLMTLPISRAEAVAGKFLAAWVFSGLALLLTFPMVLTVNYLSEGASFLVGALLAGLVYQAFPYTVLVLYPALARLDPYLEEAARTLGSSPLRAFFTVVVPALRNTIVATTIMVFVFALGSYLLPQLLGRPQHWTLSVLITDQAIYQSNMPFAAAMAVFLVLVSLALVGLALLAGRREETT